MWPFRRRKPVSKAKKAFKRLITGVVIGGAIGTIIGKTMLDGDEEDKDE